MTRCGPKYTVLGIICFLALSCILQATAHGPQPEIGGIGSVEQCLTYDKRSGRLECFSQLCEPSFHCAVALVADATNHLGAPKGMETITDIMSDAERFDSNGTQHDLAHIVGRSLAKFHGSTGDVFITCPHDFQYGCVHGFFEQILGSAATSTEAASSICDSITTEPIQLNQFFCYHGIGHGVMMASANHPGQSLALCDTITQDDLYRKGCHQGVMHENINAYIAGDARGGAFRKTEPLYPCTQFPREHHWGCYINQAPYLLSIQDFHFARSAAYCLDAPRNMIATCLGRFGQLAADPRWRSRMKERSLDRNSASEVDDTITLCNLAPSRYEKYCDDGAVTHFFTLDRPDNAVAFCTNLPEDRRDRCAATMGDRLQRRQLSTDSCNQLPKEHQETCQVQPGTMITIVEGERPTLLQRIGRSLTHFQWRIRTIPSALLESTQKHDDPYALEVVDLEAPAEVVEGLRTATIHFDGTAFTPNEVMIRKGETVTWVNDSNDFFWPASDVHPTHEQYSAFDALKPLDVGQEYSFAFTKAGDWTFHDHWHPSAIGIVHVEE